MSKKMFSRERGKLRFSALLILIGLLLFGCDPTMVTITYKANGGEGEMKPQAVESGVEVKLSANTFTKEGSDFTGWNEAADGSGKAYADGATVAPTGNLTLYAQWQVKSTPEDPDPENPGTENPEPPVVLENHITNLPLIYVVEQAYAEIGWTKTAEGYVDMTIAKNQELVAGVTSLGSDGDMYLNGIEYFTGLQVLILENNRVLTKLPDLTSLNSLRSLSVTSSGLTAVSDLPVSLETLNLNTNKLTTLNVSELTNLTHLDVSVNELTELDVDTNTKLIYLACFTNRMNELDITNVEAFSKTSSDPTPILACGLQEDAEGVLQALRLIATQAQKDALALLIPAPAADLESLTELQKPNVGVVWDVPKAELELTEGTAVFDAASGLKLPFTVVNAGALPEEELTQLLANATKTVTLFTADNETGTPVETGISHGVDGSTPYISVEAAAFPQESTTYSKIEVELQAEGYVTQTLTYTNVSVNPEQPGGGESDVDLQLTEGTAVFDAASGLKLPFTVDNPGSLTQEKLTQLLANATKTVTLFTTADDETGTPVETGISHGVDGSTPHISVPAAAFPPGETTYSKIEVVLQAEGYVTQPLTYTDVSVNVPKAELGIAAGTADFNKTTGLTLSFDGQALPVGASASVSLNGTQVDSTHVSISGNAVIVDLEALTNDTVGMTVTVTVSADGYNDAVLPYEGVSTVWIPDGVTATLEAVSPENTFIEGEVLTVTLTADGESTGKIKITSAEAAGTDISFTDSTITVPNVESGSVTLTLTLGKDGTEETVSATVELAKIYDSTHVRYDGQIFQQVKGFDFSTENTAKTAGVQILKQKTPEDNNSWQEDSDWSDVRYILGEGYQFTTTSSSGGMRFVFPATDGDLDFELIMVEAKWDNNSQANLHMSYWYAQSKTYGYSFYKTGQSFFMVGGYNFDAAYGFNADVTENTFNRFYAFDNGTNHSGRVNDGMVHSFTLSAPDNRTLDTLDKLHLEFSKQVDCTYTLKTVNFYKPLSN